MTTTVQRALPIVLLAVFTFVLGSTLFLTVAHAQSLDQINQQKSAKEAQLTSVFSEIEKIRNSGASITEKLSLLRKEVKQLESLTKDLQNDLSALDETYSAQTQKLAKAQEDLQKKRAELYIHSQKTLPQIMLSSGSFGEFMKTLLYEKIAYSALVEQSRQLRAQVVTQQQIIGQISQSRLSINQQLTAARSKVAELEAEQSDINASLQSRYQKQSSLAREIASLSQQAQSIINKKATSNGTPNQGGGNNGGGGGNTVPPSNTPGEYALTITGMNLTTNINGPVRIVSTSGYLTTAYDATFTGNVHKYRGTLEFRHDSNVRLINELPLETYLLGLGEMPSSWHLEALKAQAIAGRTYAVGKINGNGGKLNMYQYDLRDDVNDQNYEGYGKESQGGNWVPAVQQTKDRVAKSGNSYISTYYHSTCGGHTLASKEVWGGERAYAQAESDRFLQGSAWVSYEEKAGATRALWSAGTTANPTAYLQDFINAALYLGANNNSASAQNNVACTLNTLNQTTGACSSSGKTVYTSAKLREVLGANSIESKVGTVTSVQQVYDDGGTSIGQNSKYTKQLRIIGSKGSMTLDGPVFKLAYNLRAPGTNWLASSLYDIKKSGSNWQMLSRGWGHRVGMCQYGAYGRALAGQSSDQILKAYYKGISITNYTFPRAIRIGLTKAGGKSTYIKSTTAVTLYDKNGVVTSVPANTIIRLR